MNIRATRVLAPLLLCACAGGSYNQGNEKFVDTGSGASDGGSDDGGTDDGGSEDGGSDDGGSDDGGTSDDGSGDDGGPTACTHSWLPIDQPGWSKTYRVTFNGAEGTGTETGYGPLDSHPMTAEGDVYGISVLIETDEWTYNVLESIGCDTDGEGMFLYDYAGDWSYVIFGFPIAGTVDATLSPHRRFLPPEYAIGASGNWNYNYTTTMTTMMTGGGGGGGGGEPQVASLNYEGTFAEAGVSSLVLESGETVMAYKLVNTFVRNGMAPFGAPLPESGYIEQWFVEGLGLVKEVNIDDAQPEPVLTKDLISYTGLSIIE